MKILILGVNGFIGSHLAERILKETDWEIFGMDLSSDKLGDLTNNKRFKFLEGDISINHEWISYHVKQADICIPLVAIATPATYISDPLSVFKLDFEENLIIIKECAKFNTRVIFPSTSEVYGMCKDDEFSVKTSNFIYGPIHKQRWIYACAKQLLDRVIWAMGIHENLKFTLFRPFNWIGPKLDNINEAKIGSSRVLTQFLGHMLRGEDIHLVDGGEQRRCFTYIDDGIDMLMKIIRNENNVCDGQIFNIGNPNNDRSIKDLAEKMIDVLKKSKDFPSEKLKTKIIAVASEEYYGEGYEDMKARKPDISEGKDLLGWDPKHSFDEAVEKTINYYLNSGGINF